MLDYAMKKLSYKKPRFLIRYTHQDRDFIQNIVHTLGELGGDVLLYDADLICGDFVPSSFSPREGIPTYVIYILSGIADWFSKDFEQARIRKKTWLNPVFILLDNTEHPIEAYEYDTVRFRGEWGNNIDFQQSLSTFLSYVKDAFEVLSQDEFDFYLDNYSRFAWIEKNLVRTCGELIGALDSTQFGDSCSHYMTMKNIIGGNWLVLTLKELQYILPSNLNGSPHLSELNNMINEIIQFIEVNFPDLDSFHEVRPADLLRFKLADVTKIIGNLRLWAETRLISDKE
jgi:hypothetical protein